jgi:small GTP-binding protein
MKKNEEIKELVEKLKEAGISLTEDQVAQLAGILEKDFSYVPKIGVFGKTGAGKSSFVNAIFGQDVCPVSDVEACTRKLQEANVGGIILVDCPGIAESAERDEEYKKMYTELIPKLDAIIWVLKGDDRSYGPDLDFYELIKHCFKTEDGKNAPVFFALNQVDKIAPFREWNEKDCEPGDNQRKNIITVR